MGIEIRTDEKGRQLPPWEQPEARAAMGYPKRVSPADRDAALRALGLVDDPEAHGRHKPTPRGRVHCGRRQYKNGFAPCQLSSPWTWSTE